MWHNFAGDHVEMAHTFNLTFGDNGDVAWYHNHEFNDIFKRVTDFETGITKNGEYYRVADYKDGKDVLVMIQYFPNIPAIRVAYSNNGRILEFFNN
jgi:hypothetical protein